MDPPPPPPPPHGENPKSSSGLPPGKYDIFIIPPHSSGSGFLYLPSLKPNTNSFAAGFASALILVALCSAILPTAQLWWNSVRNSGGAGMMLVSVGLAIGAWALGRMQTEGGFSGKSSGNGQGDASAGAPPGGPPPHGGAAGGGQNGYTPGGGAHSRSQSHGAGYGGGGAPPPQNGYAGGAGSWGSHTPPPKPNGWQQRGETPPQPQPGASTHTPPPNTGAHNTGPTPNNHNTNSTNAPPPPRPKPERSQPSGWERAREETRRKEEERRKAAELQRQKEEAERKLRAEKEEAERKLRAEKEEAERKLKEAREKEQRERQAREAARERIAREAREARAARDAKLAAEKRAKEEAAAKVQREKEEADRKAAEAESKAKAEAEEKKAKAWAAAKIQAAAIQAKLAAEQARKKEAEERAAREKASATSGLGTDRRQGSAYAYSAMGEKTNPWPRGYPTAPASVSATTSATPRAAPGSAAAAAARNSPSPTKRPAPPPANVPSQTGTEDSYSYRPYDTPKRPPHTKAPSSIYSGTSYAESATTSATSAPPSMRGAYSTKDPDKIIIKAVYSFNNAHTRTPVTQLVSGTGSVTDGLILRITTEGLFIDDDVRHVPQREWDVKAWTLKLVEVGCPCFPSGFGAPPKPPPLKMFGNNAKNTVNGEGWQGAEADGKLVDFLGKCKGNCRLGLSPASVGSNRQSMGSQADTRSSQTGQSAKLHVLRASIRDQEGKKYVFVISEEEGWKIAVGLQRLRRGTQVRALGVSGMSKGDCSSTLTNLGWA